MEKRFRRSGLCSRTNNLARNSCQDQEYQHSEAEDADHKIDEDEAADLELDVIDTTSDGGYGLQHLTG